MTFGPMEVTPNPSPINTLANRFRADVVSVNGCRVLRETLVKGTEPGRMRSGCYGAAFKEDHNWFCLCCF